MMTASIGKKANVTPSKKGSIIADNNILPDPDEALKLGKSISLIEISSNKESNEADDEERELEMLTSDNERTESKREVARSEKADEETTDDKEIHDDEEPSSWHRSLASNPDFL
ncbi:hypothetical protein Tco_0496188 [Tanacetum coccineum]